MQKGEGGGAAAIFGLEEYAVNYFSASVQNYYL
jgi:hypothetical protein